MLRSTEKLTGFTIHATDGEIGNIETFYFDDHHWSIRYLVVNTGSWLFGRKVLLAPDVLGGITWEAGTISTRLTKEQVENSPNVNTDKPVSRQHEVSLAEYYSWHPYWTAPTYGFGGTLAAGPVAMHRTEMAQPTTLEKERTAIKEESQDPHLRSIDEVTGYYIQASDGDIGHVEDFIFDEQSWSIYYMVVDTRNWLPGKKVLVAPQWIDSVSWTDRTVVVNLSQDAVKNSPEYDPNQPLIRTYEEKLYSHYDRPGYWGAK